MGGLLGLRKATFTELCIAVKLPKSSMSRHLAILEDQGFVMRSRGFIFAVPGPRTFIEITPKGEDAIKSHLEMIRTTANELLSNLPMRGELPKA